jgi:hypothetical protein
MKKGPIKYIRGEGFNMLFNSQTGLTLKWGKTEDEDPHFCPWGPELLDISMSQRCSKKCPYCFPPGTKVNTVGGPVPIEDISEGDLVIGWACKESRPRIQEVLETYKHDHEGEIIELELENGHTLLLTPNHEVMLSNGHWVRADGLRENDDVISF